MRVRCVRTAEVSQAIVAGFNYTVQSVLDDGRVMLESFGGPWLAYRFKPIVRIKAPTQWVADPEHLTDSMRFWTERAFRGSSRRAGY